MVVLETFKGQQYFIAQPELPVIVGRTTQSTAAPSGSGGAQEDGARDPVAPENVTVRLAGGANGDGGALNQLGRTHTDDGN